MSSFKEFSTEGKFCKILILYRVLDTERNWYDKEAVPEGRYENLPLSMTRERNELFSLWRAIDILQRNPTKRIGLEFKSQLLILDFREDIESEEWTTTLQRLRDNPSFYNAALANDILHMRDLKELNGRVTDSDVRNFTSNVRKSYHTLKHCSDPSPVARDWLPDSFLLYMRREEADLSA